MNLFILTDLKGIAGVDSIEFMDRTGEKYPVAYKMLERSLNLAIDARTPEKTVGKITKCAEFKF